jgi:ribosome biogenesis GTPase
VLRALKSAVYFNDGAEEFPTTGDFVLIQYNEQGDSVITRTLPRRSYFARKNPTLGQGEQPSPQTSTACSSCSR